MAKWPGRSCALRGRRSTAGGVTVTPSTISIVSAFVWLMSVTLVLATAACATNERAPTPPSATTSHTPRESSPTPPPTPADPATVAQQRALAAYEAMWAAYDDAGRAPAADHDDERLARHADGRALDILASGLASLRDQGLVIDGEVALYPEVVQLSPAAHPTEAEVEDCGDTSDWLTVEADTGEVTDDPRGRQLVFATVRDVGDGEWKVVDFAIREVGSCS